MTILKIGLAEDPRHGALHFLARPAAGLAPLLDEVLAATKLATCDRLVGQELIRSAPVRMRSDR